MKENKDKLIISYKSIYAILTSFLWWVGLENKNNFVACDKHKL